MGSELGIAVLIFLGLFLVLILVKIVAGRWSQVGLSLEDIVAVGMAVLLFCILTMLIPFLWREHNLGWLGSTPLGPFGLVFGMFLLVVFPIMGLRSVLEEWGVQSPFANGIMAIGALLGFIVLIIRLL